MSLRAAADPASGRADIMRDRGSKLAGAPPSQLETKMRYLKQLALALTALSLVPSGAHLFELPAKMALSRNAYFLVQGIYAGWAWFAVPIIGAILANGGLFASQRRHDPESARWALASAVLIAMSLIIFFIWVFPANQATTNWTHIPGDWERLRRDWEYGHAANALIVFAALLATGRAVAGSRDVRGRGRS